MQEEFRIKYPSVRIFAIRNKMVEIPENFSSEKSETLCCCGDREIMSHIYYCEILSENRKQKTSYEKIYNGSISEKTEVYKWFEANFKVREIIQNKC